jgi:NADH:ubiquinone oxidoreductase subunit 2 (subunit N)
MNVPGPVLLAVGPLAAALVVWLLGRWPRVAAAVGTVLAWSLGLWLRLAVDGGESVLIYGRSLTLTPGIQLLFLLLLLSFGMLFLLALLWPQGRYFVAASLAALSPMALAVMIRPLTLGALFWLMAAIFLGVVVQSDQAGQTQGAWRYVVMMFLAVLLLLVGGWMADTVQSALQEMAGQLLGVAFLILLAGFPFHIWLQPVLTVGKNLALVLVLGLGQILLTLFIYDWLAAYPWIQTGPRFRLFIQWGSGLTALTAGAFALTMPSLRRLLGSLLLLDMSVSLALLLVPVGLGWETAVRLPLLRSISLLLIMLGWQTLPDIQLEVGWRGLGRQRPMAALTLGYGLLSLLGLPLAAGFPGRWAAFALIAREPDVSFWLPIVLLLAMGGGIYGVWRGLAPLLMGGETAAADHQPIAVQIGLLLGLVVGVLLAVTPLAMTFVQQLVLLWLRAG